MYRKKLGEILREGVCEGLRTIQKKAQKEGLKREPAAGGGSANKRETTKEKQKQQSNKYIGRKSIERAAPNKERSKRAGSSAATDGACP